MKIRFSFLFYVLILSFIYSIAFTGSISSQTRPTSKLNIEIPKLVARVNGVDIESKYIQFRLSQIIKKINR
ncbi:MAG: hypothetical protein VX227_03530, partial [Nitrospinota bacterium]|nr:hypothetical protein [Nitrospinota bacterium]